MSEDNKQPVAEKKKMSGCMIALLVVGIIGVLSIGGCMMMGGLFVAGTAAVIDEMEKEAAYIPEEISTTEDVITTGQYEISVQEIAITSVLGGEFYKENAAGGGTFVAVLWSYKNISNAPIGSFSTPSIELLSPEGVRYDVAVGASSALRGQVDVTEKSFSDLSPGIQVKCADAFEVSKELLEAGGWSILIDADSKVRYKVN